MYRGLPQRWGKCNRQVAPDKTRLLRCSRFHPSMPRFTFLGFEFSWMPDWHGVPRGKRRTARQKRQAACRRITAWIKQHRHLPGRAFYRRLNTQLQGHSNSYGLHGNGRALHRFVERAMRGVFTWRNRRGGKRQRFTWEPCTQGLERVKIARPRITEGKRRRGVA